MYGGINHNDFTMKSEQYRDAYNNQYQNRGMKRRYEEDDEEDCFGIREPKMPFILIEGEHYEEYDREGEDRSIPMSPMSNNDPYVTFPQTPINGPDNSHYNQQQAQNYQYSGVCMNTMQQDQYGTHQPVDNAQQYQQTHGQTMQYVQQKYQHPSMYEGGPEQTAQYTQLAIQGPKMQPDQTQSMQPASASTQAYDYDQYQPSPSDGSEVAPSYGAPEEQDETPSVEQKELASSENDMEKFCDVASHIVIVGGRKVKMTMGEIRRRMSGPEQQDWKMLARLTRHPKTSSNSFRRKLYKHGFDHDNVDDSDDSPAVSTISCLMEDDAILLVKDFNKIISVELTKSVLGSIIGAATLACGNSPSDLTQYLEKIVELLSCAKIHLLRAGREPAAVMEALEIDCPDTKAVCDFSLWTHGFGPLAAAHVLQSLITVLQQYNCSCPTEESIKATFAPLSQPTTDTTAETNKKDAGTDMDRSLLNHQSDDIDVYDDTILPRIQYDTEPIKEMREIVRDYPNHAAWLRLVAGSIAEAMTRVGTTPEERRVETVADLNLMRFAMISHHFGHTFYASVMKWLLKTM